MRPVRLVSRQSGTPDMIGSVRNFLAREREQTLRQIEEGIGINKNSVHTIIEDLGRLKIYSWFMLHKLPKEQNVKRMEGVEDFITMCVNYLSFLHITVT